MYSAAMEFWTEQISSVGSVIVREPLTSRDSGGRVGNGVVHGARSSFLDDMCDGKLVHSNSRFYAPEETTNK